MLLLTSDSNKNTKNVLLSPCLRVGNNAINPSVLILGCEKINGVENWIGFLPRMFRILVHVNKCADLMTLDEKIK